jgi:predicted ATPase
MYHMAESQKRRPLNMPAPYLRGIWLEECLVPDAAAYPFCLPLFQRDFELHFDHSITIAVGENGTANPRFWRQ